MPIKYQLRSIKRFKPNQADPTRFYTTEASGQAWEVYATRTSPVIPLPPSLYARCARARTAADAGTDSHTRAVCCCPSHRRCPGIAKALFCCEFGFLSYKRPPEDEAAGAGAGAGAESVAEPVVVAKP